MNFKELYLSQNKSNILQAKRNILREIDYKIDNLNNYIIGRTTEHIDYSDVETAKQHYDNLIELRKSINIDDDKFIELDFDKIESKLKEERIYITKNYVFNITSYYTGGTITSSSITGTKIVLQE